LLSVGHISKIKVKNLHKGGSYDDLYRPKKQDTNLHADLPLHQK
jgi:hypothetical protein